MEQEGVRTGVCENLSVGFRFLVVVVVVVVADCLELVWAKQKHVCLCVFQRLPEECVCTVRQFGWRAVQIRYFNDYSHKFFRGV